MTTASLSFNLLPQHFPFWAAKVVPTLGVKAVQFFAEMTNAHPVDFSATAAGLAAPATRDSLSADPSLDPLWAGSLSNVALPPVADPANPPATPYTLFCDNNGMNDLWMAVTWPAKP